MHLMWITVYFLGFRVAVGRDGGIVEPRDFDNDWYFVISINLRAAGVGKNATFLCTGTILTHKVAMTTKSCIEPYRMHQLMINSDKYKIDLNGKWHNHHHNVDVRFIHPKYDFALFGVLPEFRRQLHPSMFPPFSDPSNVPVDSECRTAGFGSPVYPYESTTQLMYQTLTIKSSANFNVTMSKEAETLWGQICYRDQEPWLLSVLVQQQLGSGFPGGPLICTIHGTELLVGMSLSRSHKKCLTKFLNLSYLMKEMKFFIKANPVRNRPQRNGQASLTAVCSQSFAGFAIIRILF